MTRDERRMRLRLRSHMRLMCLLPLVFGSSVQAWTGVDNSDAPDGTMIFGGGHAQQLPEPRFVPATVIVPKSGTANPAQAAVEEIKKKLQNKQFDDALKAANKLIQENSALVDGYVLQSAAYVGKNDFASARRSLEKALSLQPNNVQILEGLAQVALLEKDVGGARNRYQAILTQDPKNVAALLGMAQVESGNEKDSLAWMEKARSANPKDPTPRIALATHYLLGRKQEAALAELVAADQLAPNNPKILALMGQAQIASGKKSEALATYGKLVSLTNSPMAHYRLGLARIDTGDTTGGAASLNRALQLKPDYSEAVYALASLHVRAKQYDEALRIARELQRLSPKSSAGFEIEGDVLFAQRKYAEAIKAYEAAFALRQSGASLVKIHAAQVMVSGKSASDAKVRQWLKDHPDDVAVADYLASLAIKDGQNKTAIEQYEAILKRRPDDVLALSSLAALLQEEKDKRALETAERAYTLGPDSANASAVLGWILVEQGDTARGLDLLRKAVAAAPQDSEVRYRLALGLARSGDKANARKELQALLQKDQLFARRAAAQSLLDQL